MCLRVFMSTKNVNSKMFEWYEGGRERRKSKKETKQTHRIKNDVHIWEHGYSPKHRRCGRRETFWMFMWLNKIWSHSAHLCISRSSPFHQSNSQLLHFLKLYQMDATNTRNDFMQFIYYYINCNSYHQLQVEISLHWIKCHWIWMGSR